jgi:hypothetical protein
VVDDARTFHAIDDGHYRLAVPDLGVVLEIDRLRRERHELIGELTVRCALAGARTVDGVLSIGSFNLSSPTARTQRAKLLREQSDAELPFLDLLEELCQRTIAAERNGSPARPLQSYERPGPDAEYLIDGWRLLRDHPTIAFGDGGSLKSYLALYAAGRLAAEGIQVLMADAELGGGDHHDRLVRLFGEPGPTVHYLRCERPLIDEADRIRREVRRLAIDFVIYDSIAPLCGGPPEAAEHATAYFRAVRQIGVGSLHVAHINRSENGDQKPFGSSFWHNLARATFFVKQASASTDGREVNVGVFQRKANLGPVRPAIGFRFGFETERTTVTRVDLADVEDLAGSLPLWQRIASLIKRQPMTVEAIAEELGARLDSVQKAVRRQRSFVRVPGTDGTSRIALVERRIA